MIYKSNVLKLILVFIGGFVLNISATWDWDHSTKLVPSNSIGNPVNFGTTLTFSTDNLYLAAGGISDDNKKGAVWVYKNDGYGNWNTFPAKLFPTDNVGLPVQFGYPLIFLADGNYLAVGGYCDNDYVGAAWVYKKDGFNNWDISSSKLVPSDIKGQADFGYPLAFTIDGNYFALGGDEDNNDKGAVWIYKKDSFNNWNAPVKLVPTDFTGKSLFGYSLDFTSSGDFLIIGGIMDNINKGAAWIYKKDGFGNWATTPTKLIPDNAIGAAQFGFPTIFTLDNKYLAIGGANDNNNKGAVWIYQKNNFENWDTLSIKLVPNDVIGQAQFGGALVFSIDSQYLAVGGAEDNNHKGAAWIYQKDSFGSWNTTSVKLSPNDVIGQAQFGKVLAFSKDSQYLGVSGYCDNNDKGAIWIYKKDDLGNWNTTSIKLIPNHVFGAAKFGSTLIFSNDNQYLAVGAYLDNDGIGAVWIYKNILNTTTSATQVSTSSTTQIPTTQIITTSPSSNDKTLAWVAVGTIATIIGAMIPIIICIHKKREQRYQRIRGINE